MTAVIYARYSSDSQREASIEGQLRDCKDYAEKNGITVVGTYIDRAYSAKTDDRPDFQRMIKDSGKKIFDVVLVWKLDRFARNRFDAVNYKYQLEKNGVHLVSAMEPISQGPEGIMVESMLIGMAEYYSAELALKVARGERENALQCKYNGGVVPLGFTIGKEDRLYHIDPETAPIVQEIFTRYADGEPAEKIAASLNERGLRTRTGKPFVKNSFFQIFRNRRYIGEYRYKDIVTPGGIPHQRLQRDIGGGDHPHVDGNALLPAHRVDLHLLKYPEKLGLHGGGEQVDLVEKNGAAAGELKAADAALPGRAGEGAGGVAEELGLHQLGRNRGAVDPHKVGRLAGAHGVDRVGDELLAAARLPLNEHRGGGAGGLDDLLLQAEDRGAFADDVVQSVACAPLPGQLLLVELHLAGQLADAPGQVLSVLHTLDDDIEKQPAQLPIPVKAGKIGGKGGAVGVDGLGKDRLARVEDLGGVGVGHHFPNLPADGLLCGVAGVALPARADITFFTVFGSYDNDTICSNRTIDSSGCTILQYFH